MGTSSDLKCAVPVYVVRRQAKCVEIRFGHPNGRSTKEKAVIILAGGAEGDARVERESACRQRR